MKIILDTDPGVDDAMAIFYAYAAPEIELLGLTTVFGNVYIEQATRNALFLLDILNLDIPVAEGSHKPYAHDDFKPATWIHGPEGLGDFVDIVTHRKTVDESAAEYLVKKARQHKGELVVCAIGPLTNIADAIKHDSEFVKNVAKIVIMGGAIDCAGNITPHAEANIYNDPHAAKEVLLADCKVLLVGLDVTLKTFCEPKDFVQMANEAKITGSFLHEFGKFYLNFYQKAEGLEGCGLHDSTALKACTHPQLFTIETEGIRVILEGAELGKTQRDKNSKSVSFCTGIDALAVKNLFMRRICSNH